MWRPGRADRNGGDSHGRATDTGEGEFGEGPGSPNAFDTYMVTPHCWDQDEAGKAIEKKAFDAMHNPVRMNKAGIPSAWFEAFHTDGCKITETETIYSCGDIEVVGRHDTLPLSKTGRSFSSSTPPPSSASRRWKTSTSAARP